MRPSLFRSSSFLAMDGSLDNVCIVFVSIHLQALSFYGSSDRRALQVVPSVDLLARVEDVVHDQKLKALAPSDSGAIEDDFVESVEPRVRSKE